MASGKCTFLEQALLNHSLGAVLYTPPSMVYVALSTAAFDPTSTGASLLSSEVTGDGYARASVSNNTATWSMTSNAGIKRNSVRIGFPHVASDWGTVNSFYLLDGNAMNAADRCLYGSDISPLAIPVGPGPQFAVGDLQIKES